MSRLFANTQSARGWCRSPVRIAQFRYKKVNPLRTEPPRHPNVELDRAPAHHEGTFGEIGSVGDQRVLGKSFTRDKHNNQDPCSRQ